MRKGSLPGGARAPRRRPRGGRRGPALSCQAPTPREIFGRLAAARWRVLGLAAAGGLAVFVLGQLSAPDYRATAVVRPVGLAREPSQVAFESVMSPIGTAEGSAALEDLVLLFRSRDLAAQVFRTGQAWEWVAPGRFDPERGTLRPTLWERVSGTATAPRTPSDWDAAREAGSRLEVRPNVRLGIVTLSCTAPSPEAATAVLELYLEEGRDRLQERVLHRERANAAFLISEIARIGDPVLSRSLYDSYAETLRREMLAHNRARIGFTVVDEPSTEAIGPARQSVRAGALTSLVTLLAAFLYFLEPRHARRRPVGRPC